MDKKDIRFEKIRKGLYNELLKANLHIKTFWALYAAPKEIANIRNVYLSFFITTMRSHNEIFCVSLHNVIKCKSDTANFQKMFNYIRSNKKLSKFFDLKEIEEMERTIKSHTPLINKISIVRNQYIAHNQLTKKHLVGQTNYKYEEGKKLLIDLNKILEKISIKYDRMHYWKDNNNLLDVSPPLNIEEMLKDLTDFRKNQIANRRKGVISES